MHSSEVSADNRRRYKRFTVNGKVSGDLLKENGEALTFFIIDVSKKGLGLLVDSELAENEKLSFKLDNECKELSCLVRWAINQRQDFDQIFDDPICRCGVEVVDNDKDIEDMLRNINTIILEEL